MVFSVKFDRILIFQGFERIFGGYFDDFINVKSGKNVDFSMFCRSEYRSGVFGWIWMKCLGNADFTRSLWIEQMCRSDNRTLVLKM